MLGLPPAWAELATLDPQDVCARAAVEYSEGNGYTVPVFGLPVVVDPAERTMTSPSPEAEYLLTEVPYYSHLSILHYLLQAKNIPPFGTLLKPSELKSRMIYMKGAHVLPLEPIAARFAIDAPGFLAHGALYNGQPREYGDAGVELLPLPRVPITMILWEEDDEYPARCYMLFDGVCELQLPDDVLWTVAMMTAAAMSKE